MERIGLFEVCIDRDDENYMTVAHRARLKELLDDINDDFIENILVPVVTQSGQVSLRVLDWLCTNYSKKHNVGYVIKQKKSSRWFNVNLEYKKKMSAYKRRLFDPFQRRGRINFEFNDKAYKTTVGQLSFLIWAHKNLVIQYAIKQHEKIEKCMTESIQLARSRKLTAPKRKRSSLTKAPPVDAILFTGTVTLGADSDDE